MAKRQSIRKTLAAIAKNPRPFAWKIADYPGTFHVEGRHRTPIDHIKLEIWEF